VANAIALDDSGNIYVTGSSVGSGTYEDYATIKYYPNGDTAWVRRYNGPGGSTDVAQSIAVDDSGHVYVTGRSYGSGTYSDYATIKYYPNGDTAWVRRYNGSWNAWDGAVAIALDDYGCVYVTGLSWGGSANYLTIKYYSNGDTAWVRGYNWYQDYAHAMSVDGSGCAYVTGEAFLASPFDFYWSVTVKYHPNGDTAWARMYVKCIYGETAVAVDDLGKVYVTGGSGIPSTDCDYVTIKYYANGDIAWVKWYDGLGNWDDIAYAIAVDDSGNVYVTGRSYGSGTYSDYATIKYYPNGDTAWVRRYDGLGNDRDEATDITVDGSGNVYVTGQSQQRSMHPYPNEDYATVKYDPNGNELWVKRYNGPGDSSDVATAIAIDASVTVYVTGRSVGSGTYYDYATIKYVQSATAVKDETGSREKPSEFVLSQNYPNPFNETTKIEFTLTKSGFVTLNIYDLLGRKVRTLVYEHLSSGCKSVFWDGKNDSGNDVASGIYFYQLRVADFSETKKLVLLK
jgi:hypothetical protein